MPRLTYSIRASLKQLAEMQRDICEVALEVSTKPNEKARLAEAWDTLEDRKRILRGRPLPGSLTHEKVRRQPARMQRQLTGALADPPDDQLARCTLEHAPGAVQA